MNPTVEFLIRFAIFAASHSLLASSRCKKHLEHLVPGVMPWYRLGYNLTACGLLGWLMASWPNATVLYVIPGTWYLILRGLQLVVILCAFRCIQQTGLAAFVGLPSAAPGNQLVTTGCYGRVRHPLYTLTILFLLLEPAPSSRWLVLILLSTVYCVVASRWEEHRLLQEYGAPYRDYQQTVPAFLPRWRFSRPA
jgi:protein-S-isoprenylcysteine O-methyltransferase Ste14